MNSAICSNCGFDERTRSLFSLHHPSCTPYPEISTSVTLPSSISTSVMRTSSNIYFRYAPRTPYLLAPYIPHYIFTHVMRSNTSVMRTSSHIYISHAHITTSVMRTSPTLSTSVMRTSLTSLHPSCAPHPHLYLRHAHRTSPYFYLRHAFLTPSPHPPHDPQHISTSVMRPDPISTSVMAPHPIILSASHIIIQRCIPHHNQ